MALTDPQLATRAPRVHPAWWVALVAFLTAIGAAGFRSTPGVLITPLHEEFGWPMGLIGAAVSVNLVLFGLAAPFSAALMELLGIKRLWLAPLCWSASGPCCRSG